MRNRRMRTRMYGGVRGRKTKVGRKLSFSSYSIFVLDVSQNGGASGHDSWATFLKICTL